MSTLKPEEKPGSCSLSERSSLRSILSLHSQATVQSSMTKGSDLFVAALKNEGVERIFGVPGEENLDVLESLRSSKIEFVVTRHEQAAAFMAATYGRLTGKPGICLSTLGPGALDFATGAAYAFLGAMPMILITGRKGILSSKQGRFQIADVVSSMTPLTKMARQIVSTMTIPSIVREAFRVAQQERPGPVHLELPEDIAREETPDLLPVPPHPIEIPVANPEALDRAAAIILDAERPLIMLGASASRPRLAQALSDFVRRVRIPFFNTQMGKARLPAGRAYTWGQRRSPSEITSINAASYGAKGSRVETAEGLVPALETAFKAGGINLITVPVDYSENERVLVTELRNRVSAPVST